MNKYKSRGCLITPSITMREKGVEKMEETTLGIRIPTELKERFYEVCEKNLQTPSIVLRDLIKGFTENMEEVKK